MGALKTIVVGVTIIVLGAIGTLIVNEAWNVYAVLNYQLEGPGSFFVSGDNYLDITINEGNSGNIGVVPTTEISVVNASIVGLSIRNVAPSQLNNYCQYNSTFATITNLTVVQGSSLSLWATVHISPDTETQSFSVRAFVSLPADLLHFKSKTMRNLPTELDYNQTSSHNYSLLQSLLG